eukprot:TRINITY_DN7042_c0_g1_i1.p1 TRINITY_DN7042_c0_g1~~TRINITY_DN7042_c0_g1_i1.p1  ORF type:complete len:208 (-),score=92.08 TRINITY_DN7042_c0_g1_i1:66-689(-)
MSEFETWLTKKLQDLKTDETVFLPYIISILEGEDESQEEKNEGITGLLSDILDSEAAIEKTLNEILSRWKDCVENSDKVAEPDVGLDITEKMHQITQEKLANFTISKVEKTEEEKKLKEAILFGYSEVASGSSDEDDDDGPVDLGPGNSNAADVHKESLEMREKQKEASAAKKEKDKNDRVNQKNQAEDRKKKAQEKAAKGERKSGR